MWVGRKITVYKNQPQAAKIVASALQPMAGMGYDIESKPLVDEETKIKAWKREIAAAQLLCAIRSLNPKAPVDVRVETDWDTGIVRRIEVHDDTCLALEI